MMSPRERERDVDIIYAETWSLLMMYILSV